MTTFKLTLAAAALLLPGAAQAVTIDFDDVEAPAFFFQARPLTDLYADLGVLFGGNGAILNETADFGVESGFTAPNRLGYAALDEFANGRATSLTDTIRFSAPQGTVSFDVGSGFSMLVFEARAFDAGGAMIDMASLTLGSVAQTVTLLGGISRIEITGLNARELDGYAIDNLVFDGGPAFIEVPAPAALALFGLGFAALARGRAR